jgi:type VI secretion system protein ImpA
MPVELDSLLVPLSGDAPCGADLEYDAAFLALQAAGAGKPEQQYGDTVIAGKPPDWRAVQEHATDLVQRTRDLRVAVWRLRSGTHLRGWAGAVEGLQLLHGLLLRHWAHVHPQLDAADNHNPLLRLSALAPLTPQESPYPGPPPVLSDIRQSRLTQDRNSPQIREIELGLAAADPLPGELVPTEAGILAAVRSRLAQHPDLVTSMQAGVEALEGIAAVLAEHLPASDLPDLVALRKLLAAVALAGQLADADAGAASSNAEDTTPTTSKTAAPAAVPGAIQNRDDVIRTLDRLCDWIERNEPTNPTPLLLRRAQRLMKKNFMDIIRDIAPDGIDQVKRLAGSDDNE